MDADIIGFAGTAILAVTLLPQVYKSFKNKQVGDLSLVSIILQISANVLFAVYGYMIHSLPVIISNCMVLACSLTLAYAKCCFKGEYTEVGALPAV